MNPVSCNAGAFDDGWGWFRATSTFTTIQFSGNQDAVLHVFTGSCAALQQVACSDAFEGNGPESVTIPTVVNQDYFVRVQRWISSSGINGNLCIFNSTPSAACGTTVFDSGGAAGNYSINERRIITYCPPAAGQAVSINFTQFVLEAGGFFGPFDYMQIFSGSGTGGPFMGEWWGTNNPGTITSVHPSGCLTIVFYSDNSANFAGWTAQVNCVTASDCIYVLNLLDNFGDGWGSSSVGYSINGGPFQFYTIGGASGQVYIPVNVGNTIVLNYNASGTFQNENSFNLAVLGQGGLYSSGPPPLPGIQFPHVVDCIPPPNPPEDCAGSTTICSNQAFSANTSSTGFVVDLNLANQGCLGAAERQGTWYAFSPTNTGTVAFTISPANPANDYDFAIWGPYPPGSSPATVCPPIGPPLRCSFASPSGDTGLNFVATDLSEPPAGDKWVRFISALPDQVFLLYISNFSQSGLAFSMNWNPAMTADLDCTVLPVELSALMATPRADAIDVDWTTLSQQDIVHFVVERSGDGRSFAPLGILNSGGDSFIRKDYRFVDNAPLQGLNFYRLVSVGTDGSEELSNVVTARMGTTAPVVVPNPASGQALLYTENMIPAGSLLRITDASGRLMQERSIGTDALQHNVDLSGLSAGAYMLSLHAPDGAPLGHSRFVKE